MFGGKKIKTKKYDKIINKIKSKLKSLKKTNSEKELEQNQPQ